MDSQQENSGNLPAKQTRTWDPNVTFVASRCCGRLCYASREALDSERQNDPSAAAYTDAEIAESWDFCLNHLEGEIDEAEYVRCHGVDGGDELHDDAGVRFYEYRSADEEFAGLSTWNKRAWCLGCAANARHCGAIIKPEVAAAVVVSQSCDGCDKPDTSVGQLRGLTILNETGWTHVALCSECIGVLIESAQKGFALQFGVLEVRDGDEVIITGAAA